MSFELKSLKTLPRCLKRDLGFFRKSNDKIPPNMQKIRKNTQKTQKIAVLDKINFWR